MGVAHALPEREDMTDDWKRRDDTGNRDAEGYGTDFGDDFGTVQFGDEAVEPFGAHDCFDGIGDHFP